MPAGVLTLVMMAGLPGAGKSTLSLALGQVLGWPVVDKDILEAILRAAGITQVATTPLSYDLTFALVTDLLVEQHLSVILDCPAVIPSQVERAAQLAHTARARFQVVLCLAEQDVRNERMARQVPGSSRPWRHPVRQRPSDVPGSGHDQFKHLPANTLMVDTTRPQHEVVAGVAAHLR